MTDDSADALSDRDLELLFELVAAYRNVPPNRVGPFRIHEDFDLLRGSQPPVLRHPGFSSGQFKPNWAALQRLANSGLVEFRKETVDAFNRSFSSDVVVITEGGFQLIDRAVPESEELEDLGPMNNKVWVVYGRNRAVRDLIFSILWAAGLEPLDFDRAEELSGNASPYIGDVLDAAFNQARAFLVLLTDDEEVCLRGEFRLPTDPDTIEYQPRPNVIFEAGMAMALHPSRTVIVEMGSIRRFTDLSGRLAIRWRDGGEPDRMEILKKLAAAGCDVKFARTEWMTVGADSDLQLLSNPERRPCRSTAAQANGNAAFQTGSRSPQTQLTDFAAQVSEIAVRTKIGWSTEHAIDQYKLEGAQEVLREADAELEALRLSQFVRERPALHKSIDGIRTDFNRLARDNPPKNEFRVREFWWHGDEAIQRLEATNRMFESIYESGIDPINGSALSTLRNEKACIYLNDDAEHPITAAFRQAHLLVTLPLRNEGYGTARDVKLLSVDSELEAIAAHPEGSIEALGPGEEGALWFHFRPSYPEGASQANESRFRLRFEFRDGLGNDSVGYVIHLRDLGQRKFRGYVVPERTVASPFCPRLAFDLRSSRNRT